MNCSASFLLVVLGLAPCALAPAETHLVPEDHPTISAAIDIARPGDVVSVGPGVYDEDLDFDGKGIRVESRNGPAETFLRGDTAGDTVVMDSNEPSSLVGFRVWPGRFTCIRVFGNSEIRDCVFRVTQRAVNGAILVEPDAHASVHETRFIDARFAIFNLGSCFVDDSEFRRAILAVRNIGQFEARDTIFRDGFTLNGEAGAGLFAAEASSSVFTRCRFIGNFGNVAGGAILLADNSYLRTERCDFIGNSSNGDGGAISLNNTTRADVLSCRFFGNASMDEGGAIAVQQNASLTCLNTVLARNTADVRGGGLHLRGSGTVEIRNATIADNSGALGAGGVFVAPAPSVSIDNTIVWGNLPGSFGGAGNPTVTYSNIEGGATGASNISAVPGFADPDGLDDTPGTLDDNYRLQADSPCIDAASRPLLVPDTHDLDQDLNALEPLPDADMCVRTIDDPLVPDCTTLPGSCGEGALPDMGAYERTCQADLNGDRAVDLSDLAQLLANFGLQIAVRGDGDLDLDGDVDLSDLAALLIAFGTCA